MMINAKITSSKNLKMEKTQNVMTHLIPDLQYLGITNAVVFNNKKTDWKISASSTKVCDKCYINTA